MKMLQDVTDWFKAEILGDQSLQQERSRNHRKISRSVLMKQLIMYASPIVLMMMGLHILLSAWMVPLSIKSARILESRKEKSALKM